MVKIKSVEKGTYADKAGIKSGDVLVSINGNNITDVLDYRFYMLDKKLALGICRDGEQFTLSIRKKDEYDEIGLEFETYLMDEKHSCRNKCVFCFIDQNPEGMRESIYFKDDDSRLSFFFGNYVTLTNLKNEDVARIVKMRISPVNISVHTTNPELRVKMMNNRFAGESLRFLDDFQKGEIDMNCQIVLCRGLNDGKELERTITDLSARFPYVSSIAVVPSGLTKYREGLYPLTPFTKEDAAEVIDIVERLGRENLEKHGQRIVYASDEWYLTAEREMPCSEYYEDFPQLDNGVGMIRSMGDEIDDELDYIKDSGFALGNKRHVSVVTGEAAYDFIAESAKKVCDAVPGLKCNVYCAKNYFFGGTVTVAGLLTGSDLITALDGKDLGEELFIPSVMLRHEGDLFLDNMSLDELSERLGIPITPTESTGEAFVKALVGEDYL